MAVVKQYQPHAMIFNMGNLTIRWAGNDMDLPIIPYGMLYIQLKN